MEPIKKMAAGVKPEEILCRSLDGKFLIPVGRL